MFYPSYREFKNTAGKDAFFPFVKKLAFVLDPFEVYLKLAPDSPRVLLESARFSRKMGRYSVIAKDPFLIFEYRNGKGFLDSGKTREEISEDPFSILKKLLKKYFVRKPAGLPPFLGGAIGYFGYEAKNLLEPGLSQNAVRDLDLPDIYFMFFDSGFVVDHEKKETFIFFDARVNGNPKTVYDGAARKVEALEKEIEKFAGVENFSGKKLDKNSIECSHTKPQFVAMVKKAKRYIRRGDIYQANLSQRFSFPFKAAPAEAYRALRQVNPSSFFGILETKDFSIVSGSPERLLRLEENVLESRPIAGTRSRGSSLKEDAEISLELVLNEKERAEHIMLVDLERNDLGRVAEYGSVNVDELMVVEDYSHVKHIVSNVKGTLREGLDAVDALKAFFPGGTITGTPKVRSMEVIDALEPVARGPYTGSLGYFSFTGDMDFNIIIRSLVLKKHRAYLQVGAGIVADSVPENEYDETLYKAEGLFSALFGKVATRGFFKECGASIKRAI